MKKKDLQAAYIDRLNDLLKTVDFVKLDRSCNTGDGEYAKDILKQMHDLFVGVYHTDNLDNNSYEFVNLPAVVRGQSTGHIGLGLVTLDLQSSGEHWGTWFLTPRGVIDHGSEKMKPADSKYLSSVYIPYDYWYTVNVERDHHVDFDHVPEKVADMLNSCYPDQQELKEDTLDNALHNRMNNQKSVQELRQRLDENYNALVQGWLSLDAPALIEKAEEIVATKTVYKALRDGHFRDMEYLLRFRNPLKVVRDQWMEEETCAPDEELEHVLWTVSDNSDAEQNYELEDAPHPPAPREGMKLC